MSQRYHCTWRGTFVPAYRNYSNKHFGSLTPFGNLSYMCKKSTLCPPGDELKLCKLNGNKCRQISSCWFRIWAITVSQLFLFENEKYYYNQSTTYEVMQKYTFVFRGCFGNRQNHWPEVLGMAQRTIARGQRVEVNSASGHPRLQETIVLIVTQSIMHEVML